MGDVTTADGNALKSVIEALPDFSTELVPDNFLNPVSKSTPPRSRSSLNEEANIPAEVAAVASRRTSPRRTTTSSQLPVEATELPPKVNYNIPAEVAAADSRRTSPRRSTSSNEVLAGPRRTSPRRSTTVDNVNLISGSNVPKRRYQKRNVQGKNVVNGQGDSNTNVAPKRKYQRKKSSEVKSSQGNAVPKRKYQKKDGRGKQTSPTAEPATTTDAEVSNSEGLVSDNIRNTSEQELQEPDFFAHPTDSFSISGDEETLPTIANNNLVNTSGGQGRGRGTRKQSTR